MSKDPQYEQLLKQRRAFNDMISKIDPKALRDEFNATAQKSIDALEAKIVDWAITEAKDVKGVDIDLVGGLNIFGRMASSDEMNRLDTEGDRMLVEIGKPHFEAARKVVAEKQENAHPVLRELVARLDALSERQYENYYAHAKVLQGLDDIAPPAQAKPQAQPKP